MAKKARRVTARVVDPLGGMKGNKYLDPAGLTKIDAMDEAAKQELEARKKAETEKLASDAAAAEAAATGPAIADAKRRLGKAGGAIVRGRAALSTLNASRGQDAKLG